MSQEIHCLNKALQEALRNHLVSSLLYSIGRHRQCPPDSGGEDMEPISTGKVSKISSQILKLSYYQKEEWNNRNRNIF